MKSFVKYNYGALIWALIILVLLLLPAGELPVQKVTALDKFLHLSCFAILSYLLIIGQVKQYRFSLYKYKAPFRCFLLAVAYGILTELGQMLVDTRSAEILDAVANTLGAFIGYAYFMIFLKKSITPEKN